MYRIEYKGPRRRRRVVSEDGLSAEDFRDLARDLGAQPRRARKMARIAARRASSSECVETRWNDTETRSQARPGDWIVTTLALDGTPLRDDDGHLNVYVIRGERFSSLYEPADGVQTTPHGDIFLAQGTVEALRVTGGFEIRAPWGEMQRAANGWLILNGTEVYGNHRDTFARTYQLID